MAPEPLEFVCGLYDLQEKGEVPNPVYEDTFAQTSGGVLNALDSFMTTFCDVTDHGKIFDAVEKRRRDLLGVGVLTFKYEFLCLSQMLECGGLIVIVVSRGQLVKSVDTWEHGALAPRALDRNGARALFAKGAVTVVINPEAGFLQYMVRPLPERPLRIAPALREEAQQQPAPKRARPEESEPEPEPEPSPRVREMRALIRAARAALRPETPAPLPNSSA